MWVRKSSETLAAEGARRPSLVVSLAVAAVLTAALCLGAIYGFPRFNPRSGQIVRVQPRSHSARAVMIFGVLQTLAAFPLVHLFRRRRARPRSNALLCVACHEPQALGASSCTNCGGPVESMDLWQWVEPPQRSAG